MTASWLGTACRMLEVEHMLVRVTVASTRGSSPREPGATMLVSADQQWGTIGGGHLEWQAAEQARQRMRDPAAPAAHIEHLLLGPDLAQCCGGEVTLWLERLTAAEGPALRTLESTLRDAGARAALRSRLHEGQVRREAVPVDQLAAMGSSPRSAARAPSAACRVSLDAASCELVEVLDDVVQPLWIFGAGHVGQAVLRLSSRLPLFAVTCIDSRPDICAVASRETAVPVTFAPEPVECIGSAPPGTCFLVLTHDHELDYQLCAAILSRRDAAWLGLIGSASKSARFRSRLRRANFDAATIARLVSPVGLTTIRSKLPEAIAIGIVAQLLERAAVLQDAYGSAGAGISAANPSGIVAAAGAASAAASAMNRIIQAPAVAADCDPACGRCAERRLA